MYPPEFMPDLTPHGEGPPHIPASLFGAVAAIAIFGMFVMLLDGIGVIIGAVAGAIAFYLTRAVYMLPARTAAAIETSPHGSALSKQARTRLSALQRRYGDARRRNVPISIAGRVRELVEVGDGLVLAIDDGRHEHLVQELVSTYLTSLDSTLASASEMHRDGALSAERETELIELVNGTISAMEEIRQEVIRGDDEKLGNGIRFLEDRFRIDGRRLEHDSDGRGPGPQ